MEDRNHWQQSKVETYLFRSPNVAHLRTRLTGAQPEQKKLSLHKVTVFLCTEPSCISFGVRPKRGREPRQVTSVVGTRSEIRNNYRLTSDQEQVQDLFLEGFQLLMALTSHSSPVLPRNRKSATF